MLSTDTRIYYVITSSRESIANFIKMKQTETVRVLCTGSKINSRSPHAASWHVWPHYVLR